MIERIHEPQSGQATAVRPRAASGGSSFASLHAAAIASVDQDAAPAAEAASGLTQSRLDELRRELRPPRGERWEPVPGRSDYADVVAGPRNGFYVNLQEGPRQGEVFHIVRRDGRELHVYGEGRERRIVDVGPTRRPDPETVRPRDGETFEEVPGHTRYRRIEGGRRDDLYINLSGNERTGRAFEIVEREGRRFHVYGEGRNRIEVPVGGRRPASEPAQPGAGAPASGGVGDPTG